MDRDFWISRWREGRTAFHLGEVNSLLVRHAGALPSAAGSRVFVPLCGKSRDLFWLAERGHRVVGVELSEIAAHEFFVEHELNVASERVGAFVRYWSGTIEIYCGDLFALDAGVLGHVDGLYDRAALVAMPDDMRARYASHIASLLPVTASGLLITCEYAQDEMSGPPFSISDAEVQRLYRPAFAIDTLGEYPVAELAPHFRAAGLHAMSDRAYQLTRLA